MTLKGIKVNFRTDGGSISENWLSSSSRLQYDRTLIVLKQIAHHTLYVSRLCSLRALLVARCSSGIFVSIFTQVSEPCERYVPWSGSCFSNPFQKTGEHRVRVYNIIDIKKLIVLMYVQRASQQTVIALYDQIFRRSPKPCLQHSGVRAVVLIGRLVPGINLHALILN